MSDAAAAATTTTKDTGTAAAATTTATTTTDKGASASTTAAAASTTATGTAASTSKDAAATNDAAKGYWPEDWQSRVSKGDEKRTKALKKFESPEAVVESYLALERRLSSGEYTPALPKDPKPEEVSAWRKANGIPESSDKYDIKDLKVPDGDKQIVADFLKIAHTTNMNPAQAKAALGAFYAEQNRQVAAIAERDETQRQETLDKLSEEWGGQRQRNINLVRQVVTKFPESVRALIEQARLPNGRLMFNDPDVARGFAAIALELNPVGIVAPAGSGDIAKGAMAEYNDLRTFMREKRTEYNKDAGKQARMSELIDYLHANEMIDAQGNEIATSSKKKAA